MDASVSDAPSSDVKPNVIPTAASAIANGSKRSRLRKTTSSVAAITSSAAISRPEIEPVISEARSLVTTGTPVTVYVPPWERRNIGIPTAWRIHLIA